MVLNISPIYFDITGYRVIPLTNYLIGTTACGSMYASECDELMPKNNGCCFAYNMRKSTFWTKHVWIFRLLAQKFGPESPIKSKIKLVQVMTWRWVQDKSLLETVMITISDAIWFQ